MGWQATTGDAGGSSLTGSSRTGSSRTGFSLTDRALGVALLDWRVVHEGAGGEGETVFALRVGAGEGGGLPLEGAAGDLAIALDVAAGDERRPGAAVLGGVLRNVGAAPVRLGCVRFDVGAVRFPGERFRFLKNGYQSWTQARSFGPADAERVPNLAFARWMQDDVRNLASGRPGDFRGELFGALGTLGGDDGGGSAGGDAAGGGGRWLVVGQGGGWEQWLQIRVRFATPNAPPTLALALDFGGCVLPPGAEARLDDVLLVAGDHPNRAIDAWLDLVRVCRAEGDPPVGWCSWYYYFTKVGAADVDANLAAARARGVDWPLFQLDDGYQTQVGDWLSLNAKFPDGLRPLVDRIRAAGMRAGLWFAPFSARADSQLFREHPDWFLRDARGRPASAGWNPLWGLGGTFHALDTTHPEALAWLQGVVRTMVHDWGFDYLKLDFVYSAALPARAHDETVTPAGRLRLGYRAIREAAGDDVFLLGCGAPLSASVGLVDGMRIGPDVAPNWFPTLRYHLTRDPHALSAKFAIRNMLVRAQLHRRLWENDPDCLLIRDTETKLDAHERASLAHAIAITGGMFLVSDDLTRLPDAAWDQVARVQRVVSACARGRTWPLDVMEREVPELVWNTAGWLAVFNFEGRPAAKRLRFAHHLAAVTTADAAFEDVETGAGVRVVDGVLDLGTLPRHGSRLLRVRQP